MNVINHIKDFNEWIREKIGWKIIDSYLLRKMLGTVVFAITLLMTVVVVFDMSENIQRFLSHNVPWKEVFTGYYLNFIPYNDLNSKILYRNFMLIISGLV